MLTLAVFLCLVLCAAAVDWGALARGARRTYERVRRAERPRLKGTWALTLVGPDGAVKAERRFENLIVNAGFDAAKDRLFNPATVKAVFRHVAIGTDATPPASGQTALLSEIARGAGTYTDAGTAVCTVEHTFAAGVGTGAITEVGLFNDPAAGEMFNRQTFATVNKAAGDTLKATCTITLANA